VKYKASLNQGTAIILISILVILISARLNLYPDLNFQNSSIHGQGFDDGGLIPSDSRHTFISSVNLSGAISEDTDQYFTISCSDFKKFFDALSVLDIGKEVSEKNINQTILDDVENIFNSYAGNCTQLDEYEFE
jgi:hypothetical protein